MQRYKVTLVCSFPSTKGGERRTIRNQIGTYVVRAPSAKTAIAKARRRRRVSARQRPSLPARARVLYSARAC